MIRFSPEIELTAVEAEAMARGLYAVAAVDGVHERELAMIGELYQTAALEGATLGPLSPAELARVIVSPVQRELFIKTAILLSWADGKVSAAEKAKIVQFADALGVDAANVARLEAEVKDFLLRPFAGLANVDAVAAVARKLRV